METLVQEKILSSFVNEVAIESATIAPINVDINRTNATNMEYSKTMITNDESYFIKYGGYPLEGSYNAIEVYSINSLDNNKAVYIFDNFKIEGHLVYITELKQAEDGRFYGIGEYSPSNQGTKILYLIIFNNFIQDGYCQINKYYTETNIGVSAYAFRNVAKVPNVGTYFITTTDKLVKFEINILEGNKTSTATIIDGGTITDDYFTSQLNVLKNKLIYTKLWETDDFRYEYTKSVINVEEDLPNTITLRQVYYGDFSSNRYVSGVKNDPYRAVIPWRNSSGKINFTTIDINGTIKTRMNTNRVFSNNSDLYAYLTGNYVSIIEEDYQSSNTNIYLMYFDENAGLAGLTEFYSGTFSGYYSKTQILQQYNMTTLIGTAITGAQQSIVLIKNIYSPNVTSESYFDYDFCLPYYMNLFSNSNDNTSLIFSRDATARFYSGNQITSTFIVPNYLLNDGNIEKASVYGKTNYLLNDAIKDYEKNRFESLYFNFIYNLNVIDNTNGLNTLNQIGSNKIANGLWKTFDNYDLRLTKARITYEDLSTEIINLNIPTVTGNNVTFNFEVSGNITKIEYLSNDESTVYATFRTNLTGTNTITQTVRVE